MTKLGEFGRELGWGQRPLLLVVDVTRAFTEPDRAIGTDATKVIEAVNQLIQAARAGRHPIMFTRVAYDQPNMSDAGLWAQKIGVQEDLREGSEGVAFDPRLDRKPEDLILTKKYASCFFGTDLVSQLSSAGIDTVVIAGLSTSGCIRATAIDAIQYGFRPIVVEDAVGDRWDDAHHQSLFDLQAKYADLSSVKTAADKLRHSAKDLSGMAPDVLPLESKDY